MNEQVQFVDRFIPNYAGECEHCGASPTVSAERGEKLVYIGSLCGPCTWGREDMAEPENWNLDGDPPRRRVRAGK